MAGIKKLGSSIYEWYAKNYLMILMGASVIVAGSIFFIYGYIDLKSLTVWSLNLLDVIYEGRPYEYYAYCAENIYNVDSAYMGSGYLALIPWAIWNIPIWIMQRWFGVVAVGHAWALLYSKIFVVLVEGVMLYYLYKITMYFTGDIKESRMAAYLVFSSPFVLTSIFFAGQTDVVSLCLLTIAVYHLLRKKRAWFIIFAALSIAAKPYVLFAYIAIILLIEKNVWKICAYVLGGGSVTLIFNLIYLNAPMYKESMSGGPTGGQMDALLSVSIDGGIGQKIPLFVVAIVLFYFYMYMKRYDEEKSIWIVYAASVSFLLFLMLTMPKTYRMIYIAPFIFILFLYNKEKLQLNLLIEVIASACAIIVFFVRNERFFSSWYIFQFVRDRMTDFGNAALSNVRNGLGQPTFQPYVYGISAVYIAAFILLILINHPGFKAPHSEELKLGTKFILWVRALILVPLIVLSLYGN
ncbi:hypothetical protein [Kineothrix sedimenti]|uniref:DUF2029 domain-containing protein n=1 Tax=Kineothrix sedimenti TaxID=3123317 RepID=A0ABZ3EV63_9FIRM